MTGGNVEGRPDEGRPSSQEGDGSDRVSTWMPMGAALGAYRAGDAGATLTMRTDVGGEEEVPLSLFFRSPDSMGPVEAAALARARGRVLDLGAGAGAHAIPLVRAGLRVTAVEVLPEAREALRDGGVEDVRAGGLEDLDARDRFDTVLVLMNGLGLAGSLEALGSFLESLATHLAEGGEILADSTDPRGWDDPADGRYPGEVHMQLGFRGSWGEPFPFLFVDADTLRESAGARGLDAAVVAEDDEGRYLASITARRTPPAT